MSVKCLVDGLFLTFVDHAPFELDDDWFLNEVDEEGLRVDGDASRQCVHYGPIK